jgi:type III pantothenate kinase
MILSVDIGNSRIKWALWRADQITVRGVAAYEGKKLADVFDQLFSDLEKPLHVFAVSVAANEVSQGLTDWVKQHWQKNVEYLKTEKQYKNIINAYHDPGQHGADRWAAIIAGFQSFPGNAVCVINAGTAITFDLINKNGQHLGGYILPSYVTMHAALLGDTANVASTLNAKFNQSKCSASKIGVIPDNTNDAVNQGLHKLLQAGIRELCQFAQKTMGEPMQIIITGGFAEVILSYPDMPAMHHMPDLVMRGLYSIMRQRNSGADI